MEVIELISAEKEIDEEYVEDSDDNDNDEEYLRLDREVDDIMKFVLEKKVMMKMNLDYLSVAALWRCHFMFIK